MRLYSVLINLLLCASVLLSGKVAAQSKSIKPVSKLHPPVFGTLQYRASIDVMNKHLSGILIFKMQEDSSVRAVFINEIGATFFDLSLLSNSYQYLNIMQSLNKKAVKITLAKDLGMIMMRGIYQSGTTISKEAGYAELKLKRRGAVRYYLNGSNNQIQRIENYGKRKKVISISQYYLSPETMPDSIFVQHHTTDFTISLKQMHAAE